MLRVQLTEAMLTEAMLTEAMLTEAMLTKAMRLDAPGQSVLSLPNRAPTQMAPAETHRCKVPGC